MRNISLLVPTLGTSDCLHAARAGTRSSKRQDSVEPDSRPRLLVCVSTIDLRGMHVNVEGGLGPDFARVGVSYWEGTGRQTDRQLPNIRSRTPR